MEIEHPSLPKPQPLQLPNDSSSKVNPTPQIDPNIPPQPNSIPTQRLKKIGNMISKGLALPKNKINIFSPDSPGFKLAPQSCVIPSGDYGLYGPERLNQILLKEDRTDYEAQVLYKAIKTNSFFERFLEIEDNFESQALIEICKKIRYEKYHANSIICRQGDPSNRKMYIVYSGELSVHVKEADVIMNENLAREQKLFEACAEKTEKEEKNPTPHKNNVPSLTITKNNPPSPSKPASRTELTPSLQKLPSTLQKSPTMIQRSPTRKLSSSPHSPLLKTEKNGSPRNSTSEKSPKAAKGIAKLAIVTKVITQTFRLRNALKAPNMIEKFGLVVDTVSQGGFFGERALQGDKPRAATIVANTECELLVVTREMFSSMKSRFDKKKKGILDFMLTSIPTLDQVHSNGIIEKLYYLFKEKIYEHGRCITTEEAPGEHIYLIYHGVCEIVRSIKVDKTMTLKSSLAHFSPLLGIGKTANQEVLLCTILRGTFFGEEVLFQQSETYNYTVRVVSPKATIFAIHKSKFNMRFPRSAFIAMKEIFAQKIVAHEKRLSEAVSAKFHKSPEEVRKTIREQEERREVPKSDGLGKDKEVPKLVVVQKESGPYYNAFKNPRSKANFTIEEKIHLMSLHSVDLGENCLSSSAVRPLEKSGLEDIVSLELVETPRKKNLSIKTFWPESCRSMDRSSIDERIKSDRALREVRTPKSDEAIDPITGLSIKVVNGVRSYHLRDPDFAARTEYFEKIDQKMPEIKQHINKASREEMTNNIDNFRVDIGKVETEVVRRYKQKRAKKAGKDGDKGRSSSQKGDAVENIKTFLLSRKKKFEKKHEKMTNSFRSLVQSRSSSREDILLSGRGESKVMTQRSVKIETVRNEYALLPSACTTTREKSTGLGLSNQFLPTTPWSAAMTEDKDSYEELSQLKSQNEVDKATIKSLLKGSPQRKRAESHGKTNLIIKTRTEFPVNLVKVHAESAQNLDDSERKVH